MFRRDELGEMQKRRIYQALSKLFSFIAALFNVKTVRKKIASITRVATLSSNIITSIMRDMS